MVESYMLLQEPPSFTLLMAGALGTWSVYQSYAWLLACVNRSAYLAKRWQVGTGLIPAGLAALVAGWLFWPLALPIWILPITLIPVLLYYLMAWQPLWLPNWVRYSGIKTLLLTFIWTCTTAFLPMLQVQRLFSPISAYLLVDRALWMFVLCFIFDQRDAVMDAQTGRTSAATGLSAAAGDWLIAACILISLLANLYGWEVGVSMPVVLAKQLFAVLLALVYGVHRKQNQGTLFYLGIVDGMMLVSAGLVALSSWIAAR